MIFEYIFRGAEPIGSYQISGRLLDQLTGDSISTVKIHVEDMTETDNCN